MHGTWGKAEEVPGTARINVFGGTGEVNSVSCASAGNCTAGGLYTDSSGDGQVFVVSQVNGTWGKAEKVPSIAALNTGGGAGVTSVSCGSAGNCSAVGFYNDSSGESGVRGQPGRHGPWGKAEEIPGTAALDTGGDARVTSVSCGSAGNCTAGGDYSGSRHGRAFVVSQVHGIWRKAEKVPGTAALNTGGSAGVSSVSCASAGNCSAGGFYADSSGHQQVFVVSQVNGTWRKAEEVPGTAALNKGNRADLSSVSCGSAGNCSAGGSYTDRDRGHAGRVQAFVVSRT